MVLRIDYRSYLSDIQKGFQDLFPDVKLEFFFTGAEHFNSAKKVLQSFPYIRINDLLTGIKKVSVLISADMTVKEVENILSKTFKLPAQVYVKRDGYWLKNAAFDSLKLRH